MKNRWLALALICLFQSSALMAQEEFEDFDDFDISQFEEAGSSLKAFCTNKVLGQSPTQLVSFSLDYQGAADLSTPAIGAFGPETAGWTGGSGFRFNSNIPVISKNNILVNWSLNYVQFAWRDGIDLGYQNPLNVALDDDNLKWLNTNVTIFKPLNEKRFIIAQLGVEVNGDYSFNDFPGLSNARIPAAFIYGFKPNDRVMWGPGISRTYLGGSLNLLPIIYYYHTFKNEKWGVEALFPARIQMRYRANSRNVWLLGYNVEGATYRLDGFGAAANASSITQEPVELRRSEIRAGLTYSKGINDFLWISAQAGYRINYSFELDEGEFFRGFDSEDFLMETELQNTWYLQFSLSLVSP